MPTALLFGSDSETLVSAQSLIQRELGESSCVIARGIAEFRELLVSDCPDIAVTASQFAGEPFTGVDAVVIARDECPTMPVVVFALAGEQDYRLVVACLLAGAVDYVGVEERKRLGKAVREALEISSITRREGRATRALVRAGVQWRATFDAISAPLAVTNQEGVVIRANKAFQRIAGREWPDIVGRPLSESLPVSVRENEGSILDSADARGIRTYRCMIGDRWFRVTIDRAVGTDETFEEYNVFEDITATLSLERVLRESERRYHGFFDNKSLGLLDVDAVGRIRDVNETGCKILGVGRNEAIARTLEEMGFGSLSDALGSSFAGVNASPSANKVCSTRRFADGQIVWVRLTIEPIAAGAGETPSRAILFLEDIGEQKRAKDELLESEIRYHQLLDVAPVGILVVSGADIRFCNRSAAAILGAEGQESLMGTPYIALLAPDEAKKAADRIAAFRNGKPIRYPVETRFVRQDGSEIDVEIIATGIRYSSGHAELVIFSDITQRKATERALVRNEAQFRAIFQSAPLTMMVVDSSFRVRNSNAISRVGEEPFRPCDDPAIRCARRRAQRLAPEAGDTPSGRDRGPCAICELRAIARETIDSGVEAHNREVEIFVTGDHSDERRVFLVHASRISEVGQMMCLLILNDITEIKQTEETLTKTVRALTVSQERNRRHSRWIKALYAFSRAIARSKDAPSMLATALTFLERYLAFSAAWVLSPSSDGDSADTLAVSSRGAELAERMGFAVGRRVDAALFPPFVGAEVGKKIDTFAVKDGESACGEWAGFYAALRAEGIALIVRTPLATGKDSFGSVILAYPSGAQLSKDERTFIADIADIAGMALANFRLYAALRESYRRMEEVARGMEKQRRLEAMGQIASGITHDINNTLVPLKLYAEALLDRDEGLGERARRYVGLIKKSAEDIEHVTDRLRSFYKGSDYTDLESVSLPAVFSDVRDMTRPRWKDAVNRNGISIDFDISVGDGLPNVSANASELREDLMNLVFNSVDAMPRGGRISLSARPAGGDTVVVEVRDEGEGMTKEVLDRCMEPFFTTKGVRGTGLGLAEVYGSMRRFGGSVEIESSPGMGTVVRLILPAVSEDVSSGKRVAVQTKVSAANILLVDDDPRVLDVVGELLSLDGHAVSRFRSAGEALAWLEGGARPDLIITDLGMPEMDGNSFAKASKHSFPDIPIVMMTGWRKLLGATERSPDIDVYVSKPPTLESLRSVISEAQSIGAVIKRSEP